MAEWEPAIAPQGAEVQNLVLTRFLYANRYPLRSKTL
jgi:hypothetical protein